jgi:hypothetical protein
MCPCPDKLKTRQTRSAKSVERRSSHYQSGHAHRRSCAWRERRRHARDRAREWEPRRRRNDRHAVGHEGGLRRARVGVRGSDARMWHWGRGGSHRRVMGVEFGSLLGHRRSLEHLRRCLRSLDPERLARLWRASGRARGALNAARAFHSAAGRAVLARIVWRRGRARAPADADHSG